MTTKAKLKLDICLIDKCLKERWLPVLNGSISYYMTDCALCREYNIKKRCTNCPIFDDTGYRCHDNYETVYSLASQDISPNSHTVPSAKIMVDYLTDLNEKLKEQLDAD